MWFPPFELETVILDIFAGTPLLFFIVAFIVIVGMAAYFRMAQLAMFFMLGIFILLFRSYIPVAYTTLFIIIAAIAVALVINKIWNRT